MAYAQDERRAVLAFALGVYSDPDASSADREAARQRLTADTREPDLSRLTDEQLRAYVNAARELTALLVVARGGAYVAPERVTEPQSS